ncbi:MAG: hypothetical protein ILA26_07460 [Methanobrevibacter sp.]|uniref:hypothetical protein n=1 Tax=Methanobrevibacter sp. TaxID=66852 RepID=UPI001B3CEAB4|nr:hypothetical protein [Methanobrevibacter sp.]MBP3791850.1 hypothetical protein [Methanobrevibacter sp.]
MITNLLTAVQLVIVIFSLLLVFYNLMRGDNKTSTYLGLLFNTCLLWLTVI